MGIGAPGCRPAAQRTLHRPAPASAGPATPRTRKARIRDPRRRPGAPARRPGMRTATCPAPTAPDAGRAGSRRSAEDCRTKLATVHAPPGGRSAQGRGLRLRQALAVARASCERRASAQRRGADVKSDQARSAGSRRAGARRRKRERSRRLLTRAPRVHRTDERDAHAHACVHAHDIADDAAITRQQAWPLFAPAALVRRHPRSRRSNASAIPGTRHAKSQNGPAGHPSTRTRVWRAARSIARDHGTPSCFRRCACCAPSPATPGCIGQKKGKERE